MRKLLLIALLFIANYGAQAQLTGSLTVINHRSCSVEYELYGDGTICSTTCATAGPIPLAANSSAFYPSPASMPTGSGKPTYWYAFQLEITTGGGITTGPMVGSCTNLPTGAATSANYFDNCGGTATYTWSVSGSNVTVTIN